MSYNKDRDIICVLSNGGHFKGVKTAGLFGRIMMWKNSFQKEIFFRKQFRL